MEYMGNNPADTGQRNVWGIANPNMVDFFNPNFDIEGGNPFMGGGGGGGGFSVGAANDYRGRIGADTSNIPPSMRGLYENSAPSLESIQGAYDANLKNGMKHEEIMTLFNNQADNDKKFWADGFAKDPDFSNNLQRQSQAMMSSNSSQAAAKLAHERATVKNTQGQTVNDQLRASAGVFDAPRQGAMPGGRSSTYSPIIKKAPLALNPRTGRTFSSVPGQTRW